MLVQARRALEHLAPENLRFRFTANWALWIAYYFQGDRAAAGRAYAEALSIGQAAGDIITPYWPHQHLGRLQEMENQLYRAAETYRHILQLAGDQPGSRASRIWPGPHLLRVERPGRRQRYAGAELATGAAVSSCR